MIEVEKADIQAGRQRLTARPNRSMNHQQMMVFLILAALGSLSFAGFFAVQGLWLPLAFAVVQWLMLSFCFVELHRRSKTVEVFELSRDCLAVRQTGHQYNRVMSFHPGWVKVRLRPGAYRWYPQRLVLSAHGQELEVGTFLNEQERKALAQELEKLTAPVSAWRDSHTPGA